MNQDPVTIRKIDWLRVFPILNLWHAVRMGFRLRVFLPCLLLSGIFVSFTHSPDRMEGVMADANWNSFFGLLSLPVPANMVLNSVTKLLTEHLDSVFETVATVFSSMVLVTFLGIAVARATATEFCQQSRTGAVASLRFAASQLQAGFVCIVLALLIAGVPIVLHWLTGTVFDLLASNSAIASFLFPIVLLFALLAALTAVVSLLGWVLSLGAIGTDACAGSDGLSRGINYVLSHKTYVTSIFLTTIVLSNVAMILARWFIVTGIAMTDSDFSNAAFVMKSFGGMESYKMRLMMVVPNAIQLGVFLSGTTIGYILLRKAEDAIHLREMDGGGLNKGENLSPQSS